MNPPASQRGSVLVAVLVLVAFAVLLLTRLLESGNADLMLAVQQADRDRLRADAYGALETTLAVLAEFRTADGNLYAPAQGWGDPLAFARYVPREGVTVEIAFDDESGRVSLPGVSLETLTKLLAQAGIAPGDAIRAADALYAWMHREHVATYVQLGGSSESANPPFRALRSFEELAHVSEAARFFYDASGVPTPVLEEFRRQVSLYRFAPSNLNAALPAVLIASGWTELQARTLAEHRREARGRGYLRSAEEAGQAPGGFGATIQLLRINVTARQGAARLMLSTLVTWDELASLPPPMERKPSSAMGSVGKPAPAPPPQAAIVPAAGGLQYPFVILELSESTHPAKPASHEPAA